MQPGIRAAARIFCCHCGKVEQVAFLVGLTLCSTTKCHTECHTVYSAKCLKQGGLKIPGPLWSKKILLSSSRVFPCSFLLHGGIFDRRAFSFLAGSASSGSPSQDYPIWSGLLPTLECNRGDKDILKSQKLQILKFSKSSQQFDLKLVGCAPNRLKFTVYVYVILHGIYHQCMIHHTFEVFVMIIVMAFIILPILC